MAHSSFYVSSHRTSNVNQVQAKKKVLNSKNRSSKRSNLFLNKSEIKIQTAHYSIMIGINASPASISL